MIEKPTKIEFESDMEKLWLYLAHLGEFDTPRDTIVVECSPEIYMKADSYFCRFNGGKWGHGSYAIKLKVNSKVETYKIL